MSYTNKITFLSSSWLPNQHQSLGTLLHEGNIKPYKIRYINSVKILAQTLTRRNADIQDRILEAIQIKNDP